jgi:hypothetical protein
VALLPCLVVLLCLRFLESRNLLCFDAIHSSTKLAEASLTSLHVMITNRETQNYGTCAAASLALVVQSMDMTWPPHVLTPLSNP